MLRALQFLILAGLAPTFAFGDLSPDAQAMLSEARNHLKAAGRAYRDEQFTESAEQLVKARDVLGKLSATDEIRKAAEPLRESLNKAIELVRSKGDFPQLRRAPEVSFSLDIAELLASRCSGCHGAQRPRQRLRLDTFEGLMRGSQNGPVVRPGDSDSLLLAKLRGTAEGNRMPPRGDALTDEQIATIQTWVEAGAHFDGVDRGMNLGRVAAIKRRAALSSDELNASLRETALSQWRLAFPGTEPVISPSKSFLLVARTKPTEPLPIRRGFEQALRTAQRGLGTGELELRQRIVVFLFPQTYDFAEFGRMQGNGRDAKQAESYWRSDGDSDYLVLSPKAMATDKLPVADRLIPSLLLSRWGAPTWYADGMGRVLHAKQHRRDSKGRSATVQTSPVIASIKSAKQLLDGELPQSTAPLANWAFADFLSGDRRRTQRLHKLLRQDRAFGDAFASCFGGSPEELCRAWLRERAKGRKR